MREPAIDSMKLAVPVLATALLFWGYTITGRELLQACPHATSGLWNCAPANGTSAGLVVCLNICPSPSDPCAPCSNPAITCSEVDANKTSQPPRQFNATLNEYQYGNVCFSPTPPPGSTGIENSNPGLPSVSQPDGGEPVPSYTGRAPPPSGR
ncbi:g4082 [Coccomyxa viridis]|uniref:G4082 protein n=1 Tax=Coccomyxa viridis TaxID=1274662 RepID=A0ABP1FPD4_9CHLO